MGTCCKRVWGSGSFTGHICGKTAKVEREGKSYCGMHDPVRVAEKDADRAAKRDANWAVKERHWAESEAMRKSHPLLLSALTQIMRDLPHKRDWLDPVLERQALAAIESAKPNYKN